jgi:phosphatidylglycerol:prolipoprotein diacylglycerol transferase
MRATPVTESSGRRGLGGVVAYGALYVFALPVLLGVWMRRLDVVLHLAPLAAWPGAAAVVGGTGVLLMTAGTVALWRFGRGLPMSPYPPDRLVTRGVYALIPHPIYAGAVLACAGWSIWTRSRGGLLVVSPVLALAAVAFVLGYERDATATRFGLQTARGRGRTTGERGGRLFSLASPILTAWVLLCRGAEAIANSWREWRIGPVRVMSHGFYAGVGAALGVAVAVWLAGRPSLWWIVALALAAQLGAGLWAQLVEGSPQLLRPYGYFGSVLAVVLVCLAAGLAGQDAWTMLAAFAVGACVTQAAGRLRCLVQGCCHGRPVNAAWGLRYRHPRSRVVRLSHLENVPLHPTQLYSILWTLAVGLLLAVLWLRAAPLPFIAGLYLLLVGLGRFVEEHLRGEPQTVCVGGLRLYQWLAIAFVLAGGLLTSVAGAPAPAPQPLPPGAFPALAGLGVFTCFLYGVDFPNSNRRFSRLV